MDAIIDNAQFFFPIRQYIRDYGHSSFELDSQVWKHKGLETSVSFIESGVETIISNKLKVIFRHDISTLEFYKGSVSDLISLYNVISQRNRIKQLLKMKQLKG